MTSFTCYVCKQIILGDVRGLFCHLRSVHFVCELPSVSLKCGQGDCVRCYSTFNSLGRHLRLQHCDPDSSISSPPTHADLEPRAVVSESVAPVPSTSHGLGYSAGHDSSIAAASFVSSLLSSSSVTQRTIQSVVDHTSTLVSDIVHDITSDVVSMIKAANVLTDAARDDLVDRLKQYGKPFELLNTQHKRDSYFKRKCGMVEARSIFLGNRYDQSLDTATLSMKPVVKRETFQYVPVLKLLGLLLSDESILYETMCDHTSHDGMMRDFCDGLLYKSNPLFAGDKSALQLCLYYDECEVVNPLGSRRGIHKIGFIYLSLRSLRPVFNSCLSNIHIVAAFNSIDRSKYGFDRILAPLVADLQELEQGADLILRNGRILHRRGSVVQVAGDNLGLNQLCGFVESFSALHFCRICTINRADCYETDRDDSLQLRDRDQYSKQLKQVPEGTLTTRDCGIKGSCMLNSLQYFHAVENVTVDIMHDILEGVAPYELKLILSSFVFDKKYFSLELLNARIASFDYGCNDRRNKPTALTAAELRDQQKYNLNQKAAQTLCLMRMLPFLIGDKVPGDDKMWHLYLLLRYIVDLVFADACTVGDSIYLKCKIEDHHSLFRSVFPDRSLLPKHHMLVHYPFVMRQVGPLSKCSSMRFEAKHNESKRLCGIVCCFKDICRTVVYRHQLRQCVRIAAGNCASYKISVTKVTTSTVDELPSAECEVILSSVVGLKRFDDISHADAVDVCGTEYRKNMIIVVNADDEPEFCRIIRCVVVTEDIVYFVCQNLQVKDYDSHLHAYIVEYGEGLRAVNHRCLKHYRPHCINHTFDSTHDYVAFP